MFFRYHRRTMTFLTLHLQAINPEFNIARSYYLRMGKDLLGEFMLKITYGRIGHKHLQKVFSFTSQQECLQRTRYYLRKRSTAYKRIGCSYEVIHLEHDLSINREDILSWLTPRFEDALTFQRKKEQSSQNKRGILILGKHGEKKTILKESLFLPLFDSEPSFPNPPL